MQKGNIVVKNSGHSQKFLLGIFPIRFPKWVRLFKQAGDPRQNSSGMTPHLMGFTRVERVGQALPDNAPKGHLAAFTLIELLVVVIIVAILAAIALPQYQKAVIKSNYTSVKNLTHSIANAQELYYLEHGNYSDDFEKLDILMPQNTTSKIRSNSYVYSWGNCNIGSICSTPNCYQVSCKNTNAKMQYQVFLKRTAYSDNRRCVAYTANVNSIQNQICKQETGKTSGDNFTTYWTWWY